MVGGTDIEDFGRADPSKLRDVAADLREAYDVVVVDTGGGLSHDTTVPLGLADDVLLVSTPQVAALENTAKTLALAERVGGEVAGLVLTREGGSADTEDAVADLDVPLLAAIPEDSGVADSEDAGEPLVVHAEESPAAQSYRELGYELLRGVAAAVVPGGRRGGVGGRRRRARGGHRRVRNRESVAALPGDRRLPRVEREGLSERHDGGWVWQPTTRSRPAG